MENNDLLRRLEDLNKRAERTWTVTNSGFLTPAERVSAENWARHEGAEISFYGGFEDAERTMAFFAPEGEEIDCGEYIKVIHLKAHFGAPGHRDYMGAILGMGVGREWVGDIIVDGEDAWVFCQKSVYSHLVSIDKVGRYSVSAEGVELTELKLPEKKVVERKFTVMSPRLDAVVGGMFACSRTDSSRHIAAGLVSLNYVQCLKGDAHVKAGDIISLRGAGKGIIIDDSGSSRKGRIFITAEIYK